MMKSKTKSLSTENFNQKYFVLWFTIKFYDNSDHQQQQQQQQRRRQQQNGKERKLGVLWIQSWRHRYLVIGYVQRDSIAARIGLKHGDRLGYLNGIIAPKIKHVENFFTNKLSNDNDNTSTLRLGILRKHDPIMANLLQIKSNLIDDNYDCDKQYMKAKYDVNNIKQHSDQSEEDNDNDDNNQKNLRYFFVAKSCYENLKEPELYNGNISSSIINDRMNCSNCYSINTTSMINFSPTQQSTPIIDRSDQNLQEAGSTFIRNKENYQPIFIDKNISKFNETYEIQKKRPEIQKMLKTYELLSYEKKLYHKYPDTMMIKPKIEKHVKLQRALRDVKNQN